MRTDSDLENPRNKTAGQHETESGRDTRTSYLRTVTGPACPGYVDDTTASDLLLDTAFRKLDRTRTSPGRAMLYCFFRTQCSDSASYSARRRAISAFGSDPGLRAAVRAALGKTGFQPAGDLVPWLWNYRRLGLVRFLLPLRIWILVSIAALLSPALLGFEAVLYVILPVSVVNIMIHSGVTKRMQEFLEPLFYLFRLVGCAGRLVKAAGRAGHENRDDLPELRELAALYPGIRSVPKRSAFIRPVFGDGGDPLSLLLEYVKIFLLQEVLAFLSTYHKVEKLLPEMKRLYELTGRLDAFSAVAEYEAEGHEGVSVPDCADGRTVISFTGLTHPLIENCVGNTLALEKGVILTGTNMSGKSTFLRTLGLNQLLATTIGIVFASGYRTGFHAVVTSIGRADDLLSHKSMYFAEAERLLSIITLVTGRNRRYLALIDEILSGTNSADRIRASITILERLADTGSIVVSATHDLEIARALEGRYGNYHFSEHIGSGTLEFDYLIKPGIVDQRNALRILAYLGYPEDIVSMLGERAEDAADGRPDSPRRNRGAGDGGSEIE